MKTIYYYANNIYQFSYALPVYNKMGGMFVVKDILHFCQFKRYFRDLAKFGEKTVFHTPKVIIRSHEQTPSLNGVIIFFSNSIHPDKNYGSSPTLFNEHGTSDKRYGGKAVEEAVKKLKKYNYILLSGPKNRQRLEDVGLFFPESKLVKTGGTRFEAFLNGEYTREKEMKRLNIKDPSRKNILYAPTWRFGNGTLKKYGMHFAETITQEHNLMIRPHHHDHKYGNFLKLKTWLKGIKHVYFSNASNIIKSSSFNDFVLADLMISDRSAVIYEFIIFEKPIIVVQSNFKLYHEMPESMDIMHHVDIFDESVPILDLVNRCLANPKHIKFYKKMTEDSFFMDGSAIQRIVDFIENLRREA